MTDSMFLWMDAREQPMHVAPPQPGRIRALLAQMALVSLVSNLHANLLDRARPLWEFHRIGGLLGWRSAQAQPAARSSHCGGQDPRRSTPAT